MMMPSTTSLATFTTLQAKYWRQKSDQNILNSINVWNDNTTKEMTIGKMVELKTAESNETNNLKVD